MCAMEKVISAELSFLPIESENYKNDVNQALEIIRSYNIEYHIGIISTTVRGNERQLFEMIRHLFTTMDERCKFALDVKLSNVCGCEL